MKIGPRGFPPLYPDVIGNHCRKQYAIKYPAQARVARVTACATSANAWRSLQGDCPWLCDAVFAGGKEGRRHPLAIAGFTSCMALTTAYDP
jgi:3-oxoacyl-[acyl-carrier-protein] synthase II